MQVLLIFISLILIALSIWGLINLIEKIIRVHKLTLKDTTIYPLIILIAFILLMLIKFNYVNVTREVSNNLNVIVDSTTMEVTTKEIVSKKSTFEVIGSCLKDSIGVATMSVDTSIIKILVNSSDVASKFLLVTYVFLYIVSLVALLSFSIWLGLIKIKNGFFVFWRKIAKYRYEEIDYIFGFNDDCKEYIKNYYLDFNKRQLKKKRNKIQKQIKTLQKKKDLIPEQIEKLEKKRDLIQKEIEDLKNVKHRIYVLLDNSTLNKHEDEKYYLNKYKTLYLSMPFGTKEEMEKAMTSLSKNKKKVKFLCFFDDDRKLFNFATISLKIIKETENIEFILVSNIEQERFLNNMLYNRDIKDKFDVTIDESEGRIRVINKYDLISADFVCAHNFARYLTKDEINDDLTIKDCDINLYMFGFGKVNQALLRDILVCNQFVEKIEDKGTYKLSSKKMNVVIYESDPKAECFELTNTFLKFDKNSYINKEKYFDIQDDYCSHIDIRKGVSIYGDSFIKKLFDEINEKANPKDKSEARKQINFFIISLDSDFTNSDVAVKLRNNFNHIGNTKNNYFVRLKDNMYDVKDYIYEFGSNRYTLTYENIVKNHIIDLAKSASYEYNSNNDMDSEEISRKWHKLSPLKVKSNYYVAYGLYFKLSLLLTQTEANTQDGLKEALEKYEIVKFDNKQAYNERFRKLVGYNKTFNISMVLAYLEHERWNAYEISQGALPMSKEYAKELNYEYIKDLKKCKDLQLTNKTGDELYHMNIASHNGLVEYLIFMSDLKKEMNANEELSKIRDFGQNKVDFDDNTINYDFNSMNGIVYYLFPNKDENKEKSYDSKKIFIDNFLKIYERD